jgi:hypothetical protein
MKSFLSLTAVLVAFSAGASPKGNANRDPSTGKLEPSVSFVEPKDGAEVPKKFKVRMFVEGYAVKPAGDKTALSGHHHLLIDHGPIAAGQAVPVSPTSLHFGKAQTETEVELPPGKHTLTLQFADGNHVSFGPKMSQTITVNVKN